VTKLSQAELDELILSFVKTRQRKTAFVIGMTLQECEDRQITITEDEVGARVYALHDAGKIEAFGNLTKWRFSEIRLPLLGPPRLSQSELDAIILSIVETNARITANVIFDISEQCDRRSAPMSQDDIAKRIYALCKDGAIISEGVLQLWPYSTVRLPSTSE
jgi:DNA-binding Lrp family transcriptional regulator